MTTETITAAKDIIPFDPKTAVLCGQFVQAAYTMYYANPNNLTPSQSPDFPAEYQLTAWLHMQDFILGSTGPTFYGFIAQSTTEAHRFVPPLSGTSTRKMKWWDGAINRAASAGRTWLAVQVGQRSRRASCLRGCRGIQWAPRQ